MTDRYESENTRDRNGLETDLYASYRDESGAVVVYETDNDRRWLKSDAAVEIDQMV